MDLQFILLFYAVVFSGLGTAAAVDKEYEDRLAFSSGEVGNIFSDDKGQIELVIKNTSEMTSGKVFLRNEEQRLLNEYPIPRDIGRLKIDLPSKGFYSIEAAVNYRDGSMAIKKTTAAVIGKPIPDTERNRSRFGLWHVSGTPRSAEIAGARWTRGMWELIDYQLDPKGNIVSPEIKQPFYSHMTWIGTFAGSLPEWVTGKSNREKGILYPPKDWQQFESLVKQFAKDLKEFPPYFEAFNEPDAHWKGTDTELVMFESVMAKAIKSVYPETKVFGPSLYNIDIQKLRKLVEIGLLESMDGLVMHAYVNGTPPEGEFIDRIKNLKVYLASIGKADFPVYITEFGWTSAAGTWQRPVNELTQARYLSRSLTLLATEDINAYIYFCLLYKNAPNPGEAEFSILHQDQTPKPAYAAYSNTARWLLGVSGGRWLRVGQSANMALFRNGADTVVVAWDAEGSPSLFTELVPQSTEDMMGRNISNGFSGVPLNNGPVFIRISDKSLFDMVLSNPLSINRGGSVAVPFKDSWGSNVFKIKGGALEIQPNAPAGPYIIMGLTSTGWQGLSLDVREPDKR
ncbi:MAG: hypothetical protein HY037_05290 [Nitrospirae bacterium]|nr:hypothetical protein [Candidatus Troglogloeales bacterium]